MEFRKALAKFYTKWYSDCLESIKYCETRGEYKQAQDYRDSAAQYKHIIEHNKKAIEFFSKDENAFKLDRSLPVEFRGYK